MEDPLSVLLRLPQELRDHILSYILLEEETVTLKNIRYPRTAAIESRSIYSVSKRLVAYINEATNPDVNLTTIAPIGQVSRQLRSEVSYILKSNDFRIVARVQNFDFDHVSRYLRWLASQGTLGRHAVREDGTTPRVLMIELSGPYDERWKANLTRWAVSMDSLLPERDAELGALRKTVVENRPRNHFVNRAPPSVVKDLYDMHRAWPIGSGRRELDKLLMAMYLRYRSEVMMGWHWGPSVLRCGELRCAWTFM